MNEKTLRALVEAGAVKRVRIIANGACFHVEADTPSGSITASTQKRAIKTWATLDATAKGVQLLGVGRVQLDVVKWASGQKALRI
jgi:hypothetical protein